MARHASKDAVSADEWAEACERLERALDGPARREIVARALEAGGREGAFDRLRAEMERHLFPTADDVVALKPVVRRFDGLTRKEGFHVLHDWDGRAERFNRRSTPVAMLDYAARLDAGEGGAADELALLLDYYVLHVLGLYVLRAWDGGDADAALARVTRLLDLLQGPGGSRRRFVDTAETLLWVAISNYHPDDLAYDRLLEKVRTLGEGPRMRFALVGAAVLGSHLRWGFEAYYNRDLGLLRRDNFADYPWLLFSLTCLMEAYARLRERGVEGSERDRVVVALLNGLSSDVPAFVGARPQALAGHREEHERFQALWHRHRDALMAEFQAHRPSRESYSPVAFHFNFPHNVLKAVMGLGLAGVEAPNLSLDALMGVEAGEAPPPEARGELATALTEHSRRNPEHLGARRVMVIAYSTKAATRSFRTVQWSDTDEEAGAETERDGGRLRLSPYQRGAAGAG